MAKAAVGSIGAKKSRGPARVNQKYQKSHRAVKPRLERPLDVAKPNNHAERHAAKKALAVAMAAEAAEAAEAAAYAALEAAEAALQADTTPEA